MRFEALASSSAGNAYIVEDGETRILLECGLSHKKLLKLSGFALSDFRACLVSHEHKDHAKAVEDLLGRGMDVYMSAGTAEALRLEAGITPVESMEHPSPLNLQPLMKRERSIRKCSTVNSIF